jgi:hypothetical protein
LVAQEIIQLLIKNTGIHLNAKNSASQTTLDIATDTGIIKLLSSFGAKHSSKLKDSQTRESKHKPIITTWDAVLIYISRLNYTITEEQRSTSLIILTLIVTATYQSVLSPPGGLYQANAIDNNLNITASSNSTISSLGTAGKAVMSQVEFNYFSYLSVVSFLMSTLIIIIMTPRGRIAFTSPMGLFTLSYLYSMLKISPTNYIIGGVFLCIILVVISIFYTILEYSRLLRWLNAWKQLKKSALRSNTEIHTNKITLEI